MIKSVLRLSESLWKCAKLDWRVEWLGQVEEWQKITTGSKHPMKIQMLGADNFPLSCFVDINISYFRCIGKLKSFDLLCKNHSFSRYQKFRKTFIKLFSLLKFKWRGRQNISICQSHESQRKLRVTKIACKAKMNRNIPSNYNKKLSKTRLKQIDLFSFIS